MLIVLEKLSYQNHILVPVPLSLYTVYYTIRSIFSDTLSVHISPQIEASFAYHSREKCCALT